MQSEEIRKQLKQDDENVRIRAEPQRNILDKEKAK